MNIHKGFSLIELIITLAIIAVVSSMTISFSGAFLQDNRLSIANNDLVGSINLARSAAVSRGVKTSICASNDGATCTNTAWELGWIVFTDGDTAGTVDGTDTILKVSNNAGIDISITNPAGYIQFKPQGVVASVCVNCLDKTMTERLDSIFVAALKNLSPISLAHAGNSGSSGNSGDSGSSGNSGNSGNSGSSNATSQNCVAPDSQVTADSGNSGNSGNSGGSGGSGGSSASLDMQDYANYAFNVLQQISPIASAHASGHSGDSGNSGSSGGSGNSGSSGGSNSNNATCDDGEGTPQVALDDSSFLICDSSQHSERGNLISVSAVGRVARTKVSCN